MIIKNLLCKAVIFSLCFLASIFSITGCGDDPEVFGISHADEINRLLATSQEALEFFRSESLITDHEYQVPFHDAVYRDVVDSSRQEVEVVISPVRLTWDFGDYNFAQATCRSWVHCTQTKMTATDTTEKAITYQFVRRLLIVKLGDNSHLYSGWKLFGFDGGTGPVNMTMVTTDGAFRVDVTEVHAFPSPDTSESFNLQYTWLVDIANLIKGERVALSAGPKNSPLNYALVTTHAVDSGFVTQGISQSDILHFVDTLATPTNNTRLWNLILVRSFVRNSGELNPISNWFIPYRMSL